MKIIEDYVSSEIAKLLREKGFDERTIYHYTTSDTLQHNITYNQYRNSEMKNACSAPTLQMTMKWLREVHKIHIVLHPCTDKEGQSWGFIFYKYAYGCWQELGIYIIDSWNSYEEVCNAAIKYCLENLI